MTIRLIWAQDRHGAIGIGNTLPWRIPEDSRRFRALTSGAAVVMGRKTWESLPARYRPLPGRENWVLTRDPQWSADGAVTAGSFDDVRRGATSPVLWVVGGGDIYAQSLTWADECFVTEIDAVFEGDSWAPRLGSDWSANDTHPASSDWQTSQPSGLSFRYRVFERNR